MCSVFWFFWLSVLAKWLARKTPLRKPNHGEGIVSRKPRLKNAYDFLGLLYCVIVLLCTCVVSCPYMTYFPTVTARYSLFVLKVLLNPKPTNKQTKFQLSCSVVHTDYTSCYNTWSTLKVYLKNRQPSNKPLVRVITLLWKHSPKSHITLFYCADVQLTIS